MTGELAILNVGAGDTKLTFDPKKPDEVKKSATIVRDMIKRGFVLLIEAGQSDKGPTYRRALDFDPETAEYIVAGIASDITTEDEPNEQKQAGTSQRSRKGTKSRVPSRTRIPASKTKAIAVAKTAGG